MSKTRKPNPKKAAPVAKDPTPEAPEIAPLANDADSLVAEWRRLQGLIAELNVEIKTRQDTVATAENESKNLQNQGLQIIGAANELHRILVGMGVDPNKHTLPEGAPLKPADFVPEPDSAPEESYPVEEEEVVDDPRMAAMRRRFQS